MKFTKAMNRLIVFLLTCTATVALLSACGKKANANAESIKADIEISTEGENGVAVTLADRQMLTDKEGRAIFRELPPMIYTVTFRKNGFYPEWRQVDVSSGKKATVSIHMRPVITTALFTSSPTGAVIYVDGIQKGTAPLAYTDLQFGEYEVQAKLPGTNPVPKKITVNGDNAGRPIPVHFNLVSNMGKLSVTTEPAGATCLVQGENIQCSTPGTIELTEGEYLLTFSKDGYKTVENIKAIVKHEELTEATKIQLEELPGTLKITVNQPDAVVSVNNSTVDISKQLELKPGTYTVVARKKGFDNVTKTVDIQGGKNTRCDLDMEQNTGAVTFTINPPGTQIFIDVNSTGKKKLVGFSQPSEKNPDEAAPFTITGLPEGKHTLHFAHKYAPKQKNDSYVFSIEKRGSETTIPNSKLKFWTANSVCTDKKTERKYNVRILPSAANSKDVTIQIMNENGGMSSEDRPRSDFSAIEKLPPVQIDPKFNYSTFNMLTLLKEEETEAPAPAPKAESQEETRAATESGSGRGLRLENIPANCKIYINDKSYGSQTEISDLPETFTLRIVGKQEIKAKILLKPKEVKTIKIKPQQIKKLTTEE